MAKIKVGYYRVGKYYYLDIRVNGSRKRESTGLMHEKDIIKLAETKRIELSAIEVLGIEPTRKQARKRIALDDLKAQHLHSIRNYSEHHKKETERRLTVAISVLGAGRDPLTVSSEILTDYIAERKGSVSDTTINAELAALKAMYNTAINKGQLTIYPFHKFKSGLRVNKTRNTYLTDNEISELMAKLDPVHSVLDRILFIVSATALRLGDILRLTWGDIEGSTTLVVNKTNSPRLVYLPEKILGIVLRAKPQDATAADPVCASHYKDAGAVSQAVIDRVGKLIGRKVGAHCFRRSIATYALRAGVSIKDVQAMLGHSTPTMTLEYAKATTQSVQAVVNSLPWIRNGYTESMDRGAVEICPNGHETVIVAAP